MSNTNFCPRWRLFPQSKMRTPTLLGGKQDSTCSEAHVVHANRVEQLLSEWRFYNRQSLAGSVTSHATKPQTLPPTQGGGSRPPSAANHWIGWSKCC